MTTGLDTGCVYGGQLTACMLPAATRGGGSFNGLKRLLGRCVGRTADPEGKALTLQQLGGEIVSVPSRQPKIK